MNKRAYASGDEANGYCWVELAGVIVCGREDHEHNANTECKPDDGFLHHAVLLKAGTLLVHIWGIVDGCCAASHEDKAEDADDLRQDGLCRHAHVEDVGVPTLEFVHLSCTKEVGLFISP